MSSNKIFTNSLEKYKGLYYHFLDGYLNPDSGSDLIQYKNMLENNEIFHFDYTLINFIFFDLFQGIDINFLSTESKKLNITLEFHSDFGLFQESYEIENFDKIFKYCIVHTAFNNHATSLLFRIEGNKLIVGCVNSGQGIEKYPDLFYDSDKKYCLPFKNYILSENIDEYSEKIIIWNIFYIQMLFYSIMNIRYDYDFSIIEKYNNNIKKYISGVKTILNKLELTFNDVGFIMLNKDCINILDYPVDDFYENESYDRSNMLNYYEIIMNIFKKLPVHKYNFSTKFSDYKRINLNQNIKDNIILHNINGELYIKPQQSGSCSWFSLYWPLLFYHIYSNNEDEYYSLIQDIYNFYYNKAQKIFAYENFKYEDKNLILMKIICNKLLDLNLLKDKNILKDNIDFLYNYDISFHKNSLIKIEEIVDRKENKYLKPNIIKIKTDLDIIERIFNNIILFLNTELINDDLSKSINEFYILFYQLYEYSIKESKSLFQINDSINDILEQLPDKDTYKYHINKLKQLNDLIYLGSNYTYYENFRYISECKHIIYFYNSIKPILIDKNYILNFCIFINKAVLFIEVYDFFLNFSDSDTLNFLLTKLNKSTTCENFTTDNIKKKNRKIFNIFNMMDNDFHRFNRKRNENSFYYNKFYPISTFNIKDFKFKEELKQNNREEYKKLNTSLYKSRLQNYERTYGDYENLLIFLFNHPKYIFQSFNNENYIIDNCNFVKLNIYQIFENENYRNNLIIYFASKLYESYNSGNKKGLLFIIANLQLLITKYIGYFNFVDTNEPTNFIYNQNVYEYSTTSFENFKIIIDKEYNKHKDNKEAFCNYLKDNKHILVKGYLVLLKKYFTDIKIINENSISLDSDLYGFINPNPKPIPNLFLDLFNVNNETLFLFGKNHNVAQIFIITFENIIKLVIDKDKKIKTIYINNNEVIKYHDLNETFKYIIPTNCLHFIYKINDDYNVTYFVNNEYTSDLDILGKCSLTTNTYTISINKNNMMFPNKDCFDIFSKLCVNFQINKFNILYLNDNMINEKETLLCFNNKVKELFNFNKKEFFIKSLHCDIKHIKLNFIKNIEKYHQFILKISKCTVINYDKILIKIEHYLNKCKCLKDEFYFNFHNKDIKYLFENYNELYNYLLNIKIINFFTVLKNILVDENKDLIIKFCSQTKIFNDYFNVKKHSYNYTFEALFELISGNELLKEQMYRYIDIINKYNLKQSEYKNKKYLKEEYDILYNQNGGNYPLHHFMMGKGKSAIMTPILSLYFSTIHDKNIIIVVPSHLEKQTHKTMDEIIHLFDLSKKIKILTDTTIKKYYLADVFSNIDNTDTVMLIDEFDSILDPMKSNFNIINEKEKSKNLLFDLLKPNFDKPIEEQIQFVEDGNINTGILASPKYDELVKSEITKIKEQIANEILSENINWGIHPTKGYAIPYRSKGNPLLNSNFSSSVITVYLTLYFYIVLKNYELTETIVNYIIYNSLLDKLFNIDEPQIITFDFINSMISIKELKIDFFNKLITHIFNTIDIPINRYNTSFVDILNIHGIFKIGYSGTINIDLPPLTNLNKFIKDDIVEDLDESLNIEYAINKSKSYLYNPNEHIFKIDGLKLNEYSAIIDTVGFFKNRQNEFVAMEIYNFFNKERNIIYIDETDNIYAIIDGDKLVYNPNYSYKSPFIYYSQAHIVGIDIKQDNYPLMKGLCLIDENSYYSKIAQAMFRLRKLNMGHSIDFINMKKYREKEEIICYIRENEENNKNNKNKYLLFQTLKTEIRTNNNINNIGNIFNNINIIVKKEQDGITINYNNSYLEIIKYYYLDYNENSTEILKGIIVLDDKYNFLFKDIEKSIGTLVYNINSLQQEQEQEQEQQKEELLIENRTKNNEIFFNFEYKKYEFNNIKENRKTFIKYTIQISEKIKCLPNLFSQLNTLNYINNASGFLFVYIHDLLLLIPGYLLVQFNEFPLLTLNFKLINDKIINPVILEKLKNNNIYRLISSNYVSAPDNDEIKIGIIMLLFYDQITKFQHDYLEKNKILIPTIILEIKKKFNDFLQLNFNIDIVSYYNSYNKYLKYKNKYLKLINKLK